MEIANLPASALTEHKELANGKTQEKQEKQDDSLSANGAPNQGQAMEAVLHAKITVDKASGEMVDKHHELVAKSLKMQQAYRKKKAQEHTAREREATRDILNEQAIVSRINHRNRMEDARRREEAKNAGGVRG